MKTKTTTAAQGNAASAARLRRRDLCAEHQTLVQELVAAPPLLRGTLRGVTRGDRRYPGLIFNDAGRSIGRSVRLGDVTAVAALPAAYRSFRATQQRLRTLHAHILRASDALRAALTCAYATPVTAARRRTKTNDHTIPLPAARAFYNQRQGAGEHGNDHLKNDVAIGALPCRGADGLPANRVYTCFCALLHNLHEWYKHDCLPPEDTAMRLPTFMQRDRARAARDADRAHAHHHPGQ